MLASRSRQSFGSEAAVWCWDVNICSCQLTWHYTVVLYTHRSTRVVTTGHVARRCLLLLASEARSSVDGTLLDWSLSGHVDELDNDDWILPATSWTTFTYSHPLLVHQRSLCFFDSSMKLQPTFIILSSNGSNRPMSNLLRYHKTITFYYRQLDYYFSIV